MTWKMNQQKKTISLIKATRKSLSNDYRKDNNISKTMATAMHENALPVISPPKRQDAEINRGLKKRMDHLVVCVGAFKLK